MEIPTAIIGTASTRPMTMKNWVRRVGINSDLALLDVYGRVARVLLEFSEQIDGQKVVKGKLPRQDIAKMIGASREMVSRVMKGLEVGGYIEVRDDGSIVLRERLSAHL